MTRRAEGFRAVRLGAPIAVAIAVFALVPSADGGWVGSGSLGRALPAPIDLASSLSLLAGTPGWNPVLLRTMGPPAGGQPWTCHGIRTIGTPACGVAPAGPTARFPSLAGGALAWKQYSTWPSPPTQAAYDFEMTYDAVDGYVVLLGAPPAVGGGLGPTQMWKFVGGTWSQLHPNKTPMNCPGSALVYDDADGYVLYLGAPNWGYTGAIKCTTANQTWSYVGGTWTHLHPAGTPGGRYGAAVANDTADGYVLLFGGMTPTCLCNDTWTYKGGNWTQLKPAVAPSVREEAGMAYDTADGYVLLFGGVNGVLGPPGLNDSWTFHGGKWKNLKIAHSPPGPEPDAFSYDAADQSILYTTARNLSGPLREISWTYHRGVWSEVTGAGMGGQIGPVERLSGESAYDYAAGFVLFFGGYGGAALVNDSWSFRGGHWAELSPPETRSGAAWAYDPAIQGLVLFGGFDYAPFYSSYLNDTWTWSNGSWTFVPVSSGPSPGAFGSMTYDPAVAGMVLFGGYATGLSGYGRMRLVNETWEFNGTAWKNVTGAAAPPAREFAGMAYDAGDRYPVLTGGLGATGFLRDTWAFSGGAWHKLKVASAPTARAGAAVTYDPATQQVVLFGGEARSKTGQRLLLNDTWTYSAGAWTNAAAVSAPSPRTNASLVYDARTGQTLLFGGANASAVFGDLWSHSLGGWRSIALNVAPAARYLSGLAYDPTSHAAVLFGGTDGILYFSDVWRLV